MPLAPSSPADAAPRTSAEPIARRLALWTLEGGGCGREELAMRLYRFADDVATGGRLWASTVEYARKLAKAGKRRGEGPRAGLAPAGPLAAPTPARPRRGPPPPTPPPPSRAGRPA